MPKALEDCVSSVMAKWSKNPESQPENVKGKDAKEKKSVAFAICNSRIKQNWEEDQDTIGILLSGHGPVIAGVGLTNRPFLKGLPTASIVEEDGEQRIRVPFYRFGRFKHPKAPDGKLIFTPEFWGALSDNFKRNTYGQKVLLDKAHKPDAGNMGELERMDIEGDIGVGYFVPTAAGLDAVRQREYLYGSMDFYMNWQDNQINMSCSDEGFGEIILADQAEQDHYELFNPFHSKKDGKFTSGPSGATKSDNTKKSNESDYEKEHRERARLETMEPVENRLPRRGRQKGSASTHASDAAKKYYKEAKKSREKFTGSDILKSVSAEHDNWKDDLNKEGREWEKEWWSKFVSEIKRLNEEEAKQMSEDLTNESVVLTQEEYDQLKSASAKLSEFEANQEVMLGELRRQKAELYRRDVNTFIQEASLPVDGMSYSKPVLEVTKALLLNSPTGEDESIQLSDDDRTDIESIVKYFHDGVRYLLSIVPRDVPVEAPIQVRDQRPDDRTRLSAQAEKDDTELAAFVLGVELDSGEEE